MLILSILHNIFLTTSQIEQLINEEVTVIGASLPVWYFKGNTSEPAEEVFCQYTLTNKKTDSIFLVSPTKDGYTIHMPQTPDDYIPREITNEMWRTMNYQEQIKWYEDNPVPLTAKNLLSISKGGGEYLSFKEHNKTLVNKKYIATIHVVEIKTVDSLINSFT